MSFWKEYRKDSTFLLITFLLALALRLDFLLASNFRIDADEAIVGLMAKHILEGGPIPTFYYGQHYMGSFEAILAAISFKVLGVSSFALKIVPLIFALLLLPLTYLLGLRLGGRLTARFSTLFMAIPPPSLVLWSSMARGGFMEIIFLGGLAILLTLRWISQERSSLSLTFLIWVLFGFGWWVNNQIVYFIFPVSLLALLKLVKDDSEDRQGSVVSHVLLHASLGFSGFILGGLPYWIYNLRNEFVSLEMFRGASGTSLADHLSGLVTTAIPMIFGAIRFWNDEPIFSGAILVGYLLYLLPIIFIILRLKGSLAGLFIFKLNRDRGIVLTIALFFSILFIFSLSEFGYLVKAPRYLLPIYLPLFLLSAIFLTRLYRASPLIGSAWLTLILLFNLGSCYWGGRAISGEPHVYKGERVSKDHSKLINWLVTNNYNKIRTNYWIGYRIAFESEERITFKIFREPYQVRIPEYEVVTPGQDTPYVLVPSQGVRVENALKSLGLSFKKMELSGYVVLYDIKEPLVIAKPIENSRLSVQSTENNQNAALAIDDDLSTRWGTGAPQKAGMRYEVTFKDPTLISGLEYELGQWRHDYPRGLRSEIIAADGTHTVVFDENDFDDIFYFLDHPDVIRVNFPAVQAREVSFTLTGKDPVFDWSIAELTFMGGK